MGGYNVVGAAKFEGSWVEGVQVSYLLQDPHSLECVLTFQGTYSMEDALWDAAAFPVAFCGLTQRGENCCSDSPICKATCQPERPQDSFVHMGFRNQLRRIVGTKAFQDHIHANLPSCASVTTFGHSLGAAMAELYTACAERHLAAGDFGFQDFSEIGWEKNTPQIIPGPKKLFDAVFAEVTEPSLHGVMCGVGRCFLVVLICFPVAYRISKLTFCWATRAYIHTFTFYKCNNLHRFIVSGPPVPTFMLSLFNSAITYID